MPDLNKESLEIWNALKPMIDKEIEQKTRPMLQRRKAKVTTAPSLATNTIGVTEPFTQEIFIPFTTNLISASVGDYIWFEFAYGATNAVATDFASIDDKDFSVAGDLSVIGSVSIQPGPHELMKTLWTGSWSADGMATITVPGVSNYWLFIVRMDGQGTHIFASLGGGNRTYFRGIGGYAVNSSYDTIYYISATRTGDSLSFFTEGAQSGYCRSVRQDTMDATNRTVTEIIGVI